MSQRASKRRRKLREVLSIAAPSVPTAEDVATATRHLGELFARLSAAMRADLAHALAADEELILAGSIEDGMPEVTDTLRRCPARERIRMLGFVSEEDLLGLMAEKRIGIVLKNKALEAAYESRRAFLSERAGCVVTRMGTSSTASPS